MPARCCKTLTLRASERAHDRQSSCYAARMRRLILTCVASLAALIVHASPAMAQASPPTTNTLSRVMMVQSKYFAGTIFSIDVDKREYWITAKHILTGAKHPPFGSIADKSVTLRILNPGGQGKQWVSEPFSVINSGEDIDIVVLAAPQPLLKDPLPSVATGSRGVLLGGDCEFLGYPSGVGGAWRGIFENGKSQWMPFIKHCTVSAESLADKRIWFLDGINNEGFSGGPVIFLTGPQQKILGVVSGYYTEPSEVIADVPVPPHPKEPKEIVNVNSGFFAAFDISYAIDAIQKNPIGPLREDK